MERIKVNPDGYKNEFIRNINYCFNGWGGEETYNWVFERKVGNYSPEIGIVENEEDGVIAGTGYTYRKMNYNGKRTDFGIVSGSWTLPAARRKGCLTKLVEKGRELSGEKKLPFVSAFMVDTNPSSRRLRALGAKMVPVYHLFSPEVPFKDADGAKPEMMEKNSEVVQKVYNRMMETQKGFTFFDYTLQEFEKQYISRLGVTTILRINNDFAILEDGANEVKVIMHTFQDREGFLSLVKHVTNWCLNNRGLKAFFFTAREESKKACMTMGFQNILGYFTVLYTGLRIEEWEEMENFQINMADKM